MKAVGQPGREARFGRGQVHPCHADLGKSQRTGPLSDFRNQLRTVDLSAVERHLPIVETATWNTEEDTRALASRLAAHPSIANAFIELRGELGAGKTTFVRHLLQALGVQGRIKSPTYAVVEPYELERMNIWHFDFYRFSDPREWEDAGFRDIFSSPGLKLAEWPDKATGLLPPADLVLRIEVQADETRQVSLQAQTATGRELLT